METDTGLATQLAVLQQKINDIENHLSVVSNRVQIIERSTEQHATQ